MLGSLITFNQCSTCRKCCLFIENELCEAPLVTEEVRDRIIKELPKRNVEFNKVGEMWQVKLIPRGDPGRWLCPLYEATTAKCLINHYKPANCAFYPFYVMHREQQLLIALSPICPVTGSRIIDELIQYLQSGPATAMLDQARLHPELIMEYREETIVLYECSL